MVTSRINAKWLLSVWAVFVTVGCAAVDAERADEATSEQTRSVDPPPVFPDTTEGQDVAANLPVNAVQIPEGPSEILTQTGIQRGKLYVNALGRITKWVAYIDPSELPAWVLVMADEKLGTGSNERAEVEYYAGDAQKVYELSRTVGGKLLELSVREDKVVTYIEREIAVDELPEMIRAQVQKMADLTVTRATRVEYPQTVEFRLRGQTDSGEMRLYFGAEGNLMRKSRILPASMEMSLE